MTPTAPQRALENGKRVSSLITLTPGWSHYIIGTVMNVQQRLNLLENAYKEDIWALIGRKRTIRCGQQAQDGS